MKGVIAMSAAPRHPGVRSDGLSRRSVLQLGQLAGLGIGLSSLNVLAANNAPNHSRARNCILVWLDGGPSHLETFDLKPDAPSEVRGPLNAISTSVSGVTVSECLPGVAQRFNEFAVIRSMTSPLGEHNLGTHYLLTGYKPTPVLNYPSFHTVASYQARSQKTILPTNIAIPEFRVGGAKYSGHGFLPAEFGPFSLGADPAEKNFTVRDLQLSAELSLDRIERRREFARRLASWNQNGELPPNAERAFQIVTTASARAAFDLTQESSATRARYGSKTVGQSCLLARRLIERGVRFVTVNQRGWDTHENLYTRLKEGYTGAKVGVGLIPSLDLAVSALIDDLKSNGLLDETLVVIMGEFGRTPKLNTRGGRDHWPRVFSVALAGAEIRGGQIIGESDSVGESPKDRPVTPADLVSTIYTLLGLDPQSEMQTPTGRPVRLSSDEAELIPELTA